MFYDSDMKDQAVSFFRRKERKAKRKPGKCRECGGVIPKGASYLDFAGMWDRKFSAWNVCLACEDDWIRFIKVCEQKGERNVVPVYGRIKEAIEEAIYWHILEVDDPLVRKWLEQQPEESEKQRALAQMHNSSKPFI